MRRGRTRGFVVTLISQRPAVLHKNVLSQANTLIAMQLTASQDRKAAELWIKGQADVETGKRVLADLPKLKQGIGYVWSPQYELLERARFPMITTADTSATPKHDEVALEPPDPPSYAGEFPELTDLEADPLDDDEPLRCRGRGRKRGRTALQQIDKASAENIDAARVAAFREGRAMGVDEGRAEGRRAALLALRTPVFALRDGIVALAIQVETIAAAATPAATNPPKPATGAVATSPARRPIAATPGPEASVPDATVRILATLACRYPAKFTVAEWAALAGMARKGGAWTRHYRLLKSERLIEEIDGAVRATPAAFEVCGAVPEAAATREDLIRLWHEKLGGSTERVLRALIEVPQHGLDREGIAVAAGMVPRGGAFGRMLRGLVRNDLVEQRGRLYFAGRIFA